MRDWISDVCSSDLAGRGQNMGVTFVNLAPWDERKGKDNTASAIAGRLNKAIATNREARVYAFIPPAVMELGNATGFAFELQDQAGLGHDKNIGRSSCRERVCTYG